MIGAGLVGYAVSFGRQTAGRESPLMETLGRISRAAVRPREYDRLRRRLGQAGYRPRRRFTPAFAWHRPALSRLSCSPWHYSSPGACTNAVLAALCGSLVGFILPQMVLNRRIQQRSQRLRTGLPTALNLI